MPAEKVFTEPEAHLFFAKQFHGRTWALLDKKERTPEEDDLLLDNAHASLAHWRTAGTAVNVQRGEWLVARAWVALGNGEQALRHARRVEEVTGKYRAEMEDFDLAFCYESLGRAHALCGHREEAERFLQLARQAGEAIADEEDRKIFFDDLNGGDWNGVR